MLGIEAIGAEGQDRARRGLRFLLRAPLGTAATEDGADAGQELPGVEGLGQIVVGADLQADDAIDIVPPGLEHEDGQRRPPA